MPDQVLTTEELAGLRGATESWFTDLADIYRHAAAADDVYGGRGDAGGEGLVAQAVPCMVDSGSEHIQVRDMMGVLGTVQVFLVTFPANTDVRLNDHLIFTSRNNDRMRVQAVLAPESWEIERRVVASELE